MQVLGIAGLHDKAHASTGNAHHRHRNARHEALHIRNVIRAGLAVKQMHDGSIGAAQIQIDKREIASQISARTGKSLTRERVGNNVARNIAARNNEGVGGGSYFGNSRRIGRRRGRGRRGRNGNGTRRSRRTARFRRLDVALDVGARKAQFAAHAIRRKLARFRKRVHSVAAYAEQRRYVFDLQCFVFAHECPFPHQTVLDYRLFRTRNNKEKEKAARRPPFARYEVDGGAPNAPFVKQSNAWP